MSCYALMSIKVLTLTCFSVHPIAKLLLPALVNLLLSAMDRLLWTPFPEPPSRPENLPQRNWDFNLVLLWATVNQGEGEKERNEEKETENVRYHLARFQGSRGKAGIDWPVPPPALNWGPQARWNSQRGGGRGGLPHGHAYSSVGQHPQKASLLFFPGACDCHTLHPSNEYVKWIWMSEMKVTHADADDMSMCKSCYRKPQHKQNYLDREIRVFTWLPTPLVSLRKCALCVRHHLKSLFVKAPPSFGLGWHRPQHCC